MKKIILTLALIALTTVPAIAESVRCRGEIIENGTSKFVVLQKCGKPDMVNVPGHREAGRRAAPGWSCFDDQRP